MSWEDQGRQYHGWFGSGTSLGDEAGATAEVLHLAAAALAPARQEAFERYLGTSGVRELAVSLRLWAASSALSEDGFGQAVVGEAASGTASASLHDAGRAFASGNASAAGLALARVVAGEGDDGWRYVLRFSRDQGVYSAASGAVRLGLAEDRGAAGSIRTVRAESRSGRHVIGPWDILVPGTSANEAFVRAVEGALRGLRGALATQGGEDEGRPPPAISPSSGTGTPDPDFEPGPDGNQGDGLRQRRRELREEVDRSLPAGMSRADFGRLAQFEQGQARSAAASTEAPGTVVGRLKESGISRRTLELLRDFYKLDQRITPANASAEHRVRYLESIIRRY